MDFELKYFFYYLREPYFKKSLSVLVNYCGVFVVCFFFSVFFLRGFGFTVEIPFLFLVWFLL